PRTGPAGRHQSHRPRRHRADHRRSHRGSRHRPYGGPVMSMNTQGRPTGVGTGGGMGSTSGSSLLPNEPLLFEIGDTEHSGVDLPDVEIHESRLGGYMRKSPLDLAGLTEPEAMR